MEVFLVNAGQNAGLATTGQGQDGFTGLRRVAGFGAAGNDGGRHRGAQTQFRQAGSGGLLCCLRLHQPRLRQRQFAAAGQIAVGLQQRGLHGGGAGLGAAQRIVKARLRHKALAQQILRA